jgi:flagellar protein FliO/FliZ
MKWWSLVALGWNQLAFGAQTAAPGEKLSQPVGLTPSANVPGLGEVVISLALVLAAILALAFLYKKMQLKMPGNRHFKVVATLAIGPKERILVIELQGKQRVIGVTAHSVNFLFELENPLPEEKLASDFHSQLQSFLKK